MMCSPPRPITALALGSWLGFQYLEWFLSCGASLEPNQNCWLLPKYSCHYCTLRVVPFWSLLWVIGVIAAKDCWLLSSLGRLNMHHILIFMLAYKVLGFTNVFSYIHHFALFLSILTNTPLSHPLCPDVSGPLKCSPLLILFFLSPFP